MNGIAATNKKTRSQGVKSFAPHFIAHADSISLPLQHPTDSLETQATFHVTITGSLLVCEALIDLWLESGHRRLEAYAKRRNEFFMRARGNAWTTMRGFTCLAANAASQFVITVLKEIFPIADIPEYPS
jgi:hypothetical protein